MEGLKFVKLCLVITLCVSAAAAPNGTSAVVTGTTTATGIASSSQHVTTGATSPSTSIKTSVTSAGSTKGATSSVLPTVGSSGSTTGVTETTNTAATVVASASPPSTGATATPIPQSLSTQDHVSTDGVSGPATHAAIAGRSNTSTTKPQLNLQEIFNIIGTGVNNLMNSNITQGLASGIMNRNRTNTQGAANISNILGPFASLLGDPSNLGKLTAMLGDPSKLGQLTAMLGDPSKLGQLSALLGDPSNPGSIAALLKDPSKLGSLSGLLLGGNSSKAGSAAGFGGNLPNLDPSSLLPMAFQYAELMLNGLGPEGVNQPCIDDLKHIVRGLNQSEFWALQMIDSMGKLPPNLFGGNFKWLGDIDECEGVKAPAADGFDEFTGKFCRANLGVYFLPPMLQAVGGTGLTLGTCVSNRCSRNDIRLILTSLIKVSSLKMSVNTIECVEPKKLRSDAVAVICVISILAAFVLIGTLYDVVVVQLKLDSNFGNSYELASTDNRVHCHSNGSSQEKVTSVEMSSVKGPIPVDTFEENAKGSGPAQSTRPPKSRLVQILMSFSVYSNGCKLLSTAQGSGSLTAINGIRFLSMCWVILGHTLYFGMSDTINTAALYVKVLDRFSFMGILFASVSVDSFFTLSGTLVAYLTLRELAKVKGGMKFNWGMFYFHRFWRLTPPYMLVLMVGTVLVPYMAYGSMTADNYDVDMMYWCRDNWWTNLLYVNNYVKTDQPCMGHAWYLANDMQFYIISPLILLPLFYNKWAGGAVSLVFLLATTITTGVVTHEHNYPAQVGQGVPPPKDGRSFQNIYEPSYARMGPYIVGLLAGYLLYRWKCQCKIPKVLNIFLWLVSFLLCCLCVYSPYTDHGRHLMSHLESEVFTALFRTTWGVAIAWIIFACATGNGGWINELLSWSPFVPLGRLTYCAYLIHPLIMYVFYRSTVRPMYFTNMDLTYLFLGNLALSYGGAFIVSLFFESPMMGLEKAIFRGKK